jgi:hypothetical protein
MAGSPLKRKRKQGVRLEDGSTIAFPYMPRVSDLPPGWRHFSAAQKIEHLIGLDRCYQILSWGPITALDPLRRSFQMQVMRVLLPIGIKAVLDGNLDREAARERDRAAVLEALARDLRAGDKAYGENRARVEWPQENGGEARPHIPSETHTRTREPGAGGRKLDSAPSIDFATT